MGEKIKYEFGDTSFIINQIQHLYSNPTLAFKEYLSNALDNNASDINIFVSKPNKMIIIQDNGNGMNYPELSSLPKRIGLSSKRGIENARGEKGFGLLSYPSVGAKQCQIYSKKEGENAKTYNYLRMSYEEDDAFADEVSTMAFQTGDFDHGTRVILNGIEEEFINRYFIPSNIKEFAGDIFAPLLRKDELRANVGYFGKKTKLIPINAPKYSGENVLEDIIDIEYEKDGNRMKGSVELHLFVNPKGTSEKVKHYNKGVKVLNSMAFYDELSEIPWGSGKLAGEVNENFLTLTPSREAPVREGKRYASFINILKEQEEYLNEEIEKLRTDYQKHEYEEFAANYLRAIDAVVRDMKNKLPTLVRGREGDEKQKVTDDRDSGGSTHMGDEREEPPKDLGRDTVKPSEAGKEEYIRRARKIISSFYETKFDRFELEKEHLRSELDEEYGLIRINTDHAEYNEKKNDKKGLEKYIALILSKEVAYGEFKRMVKEMKMEPIEEAHNLTEIIAEFYNKGTKYMGLK